ncbi:MAG: IS3 family transposase [Candidatus Poribacteria bacterium]|nr:IS3 family transposase [Candidatus Poribacteria bacterium]
MLGFNKSTFYYQPKSDPSADVLRDEIQRLAVAYPTYGYRRITHLLVKAGYPVGYRRIARLMKEENLSVSVKRLCQTTKSLDEEHPWVNRLQTLEVSQCDQVWVGDITYVRLKGHFIYVALLMDVFTCLHAYDKSVASESTVDAISNIKTLGGSITAKRIFRDPPFRSRCAISFKCLYFDAQTPRY